MMESQSIDFSSWRHAQRVIAQGVLTNSKSPRSHVYGCYPTHISSGDRCYLWDTSVKRYIDYICGLGTNLVGYKNEMINEAIQRACRAGISHSLPSEYELIAADSLMSIVPWVERVKFLKTGTEACMASIIIARSYTNRRKVLSSGYHGWSPEFTSLTPPANGCLKYDDIEHFESLDQIDEKTAAVIIEPILLEDSPNNRKWLRTVRNRCDEVGALLIYDEIITGLRVPKLTVSEYYKIRPDILLLGKALGGGTAISAVCGRSEVMNSNYFVSSTFAGETIGLVCLTETIKILTGKPEYNVDNLWRAGAQFQDRFNAIWPEGVKIHGYNSRGRFIGEPYTLALFFQGMIKAGVLMGPSWFFNVDLEKETNTVISIANDVLIAIKQGGVELKGELPQSPFATKVRDGERDSN